MARPALEISEIRGLPEFRNALKDVGPEWVKELGKANKHAAEILAEHARGAAHFEGTKQQASLANTIRATAATVNATVVAGNSEQPYANPAFLGVRKRSGWYANKPEGKPQGPPWVGNQHDFGDSLDGPQSGEPYLFGSALRRGKQEFLTVYEQVLDDLFRRAFPEGGPERG